MSKSFVTQGFSNSYLNTASQVHLCETAALFSLSTVDSPTTPTVESPQNGTTSFIMLKHFKYIQY